MTTAGEEVLSEQWMRAAMRAPLLAARRRLVQAVLLVVAAPAAFQLYWLLLWGWRTGQRGLISNILIHILGIALAAGLPANRDALSTEPRGFMDGLSRRFRDRTDRLRALGGAMLLETTLQFAYPLLMTLAAERKLQWPVEFVIAVAACVIVWALQRVAVVQRNALRRIALIDD